ncbi:putative C2 domain-containing protein [Helianthus annuus]|uniref:C2 domain-containing protein n=1 Tax=Helianthus annuus TaxID=4232 RepID=A0A9K3H9H2_HELAN|nr:protein SRC2-like [Helianthus annuus]KAF5770124.1 putative C2 domain-containing protein [Helianthus annuus]KAJ0465073.1 putative C2 domain-containing protein [Helianthus annuus]KAJ0469787.1 putative C2 domain-containing protein [Helianthus annuus]KAJ0486665.1 putative C2 domain-containing protein [Helianthus annuus]KAJ0660799.1 putative C2 domain-containing protein [Helianthus annuus]
MEYTLDFTLVSAKGLTKASTISGTADQKVQKFKTHIDKDGGSDPMWNFPMKFTMNEAAGLENRLTLVVKIKGARMFLDKNLGEVRVPIKELLEGSKTEGKTMQNVSYQVRGRYGEPDGVVSFSYKLGSGSVYRPHAVRGAGGQGSSGNGFGTGLIDELLIRDVANSSGCGGGVVRRANSFPTISKRVFKSRVHAPLIP